MLKRVAGFFAYMAVLMTLWGSTNPPAEGFDAEGSDPEAIALADEVMVAMGGREAWDATRYLSWRFMDRRDHYWDRYSGDARVEGTTSEEEGEQPFVLLLNVNTREGRAFVGGAEVTDAEERAQWLDRAFGMWTNDSYWVFMPFKLKDSGVTLKYLGERETEQFGKPAVLELSFAEVGLTPQNRYEVYVDPKSHLVSGWAWYPEATDETPRFTLPWGDYQQVGRILLANDHGQGHDWRLRAFDELPRSVFESPEPVNVP